MFLLAFLGVKEPCIESTNASGCHQARSVRQKMIDICAHHGGVLVMERRALFYLLLYLYLHCHSYNEGSKTVTAVMKTKKDIGEFGESQAASFLRAQGYEILKTNWHWKNAEIDIIARRDGLLIFVEVKTRSYDYYGHPAESYDSAQQDRVADAANAYMLDMDYDGEVRFDLISLLKNREGTWKLEHFEDYFFPSEIEE